MRRVWLLDANLLIALTHAAHVHHAEAHAWFDAVPKRRWATCALTQLAFVRDDGLYLAASDGSAATPRSTRTRRHLHRS